jgi:hypothetical protein
VVSGSWLVRPKFSGYSPLATDYRPLALNLKAFISRCRIETHVEGISRKIDGD